MIITIITIQSHNFKQEHVLTPIQTTLPIGRNANREGNMEWGGFYNCIRNSVRRYNFSQTVEFYFSQTVEFYFYLRPGTG